MNVFGLDFSTQDRADRISYIRAWAETLRAGLGDDELTQRMERQIQETGYWNAYHEAVMSGAVPADAALRIVPPWKG